MGVALHAQGVRTSGVEGDSLLAEAERAFLNALDVSSFEHLPYDWALTQNNLGELYELRKEWQKAINCYKNVSKVYPDYSAEKLDSLKSKLK